MAKTKRKIIVNKKVKKSKRDSDQKLKASLGLTILDLNDELLEYQDKNFYQDKNLLSATKKEIREDENFKNAIKRHITSIKKEQVKRGVSKSKIKEIDDELHGRTETTIEYKGRKTKINLGKNYDYIKKVDNRINRLRDEKNMFEGKDFDFTINTGFSKTKIKKSKLIKELKKGVDIRSQLIDKTIRDIKSFEQKDSEELKKAKKRGDKNKQSFYQKRINVYKKLNNSLVFNKKIVDTGSYSNDIKLDKKGRIIKETEKYPLYIAFEGSEIRINF